MYIPRALQYELEKALQSPKVLFLLGARQVGKTTLVEQVRHRCDGGMLNMDIEVDRVRLLAAATLSPDEAVRSLGGGDVLVIDEAQRVPEIGRIVKGWYDARVSTKIILLGSASSMLLDVAAAELTGRNEKLWLTPLLFQEVLGQQEWVRPQAKADELQRHFSEQISALLLSRLVYGSYPEAYLSHETEQYLTNLSSDYLLKDMYTSSMVRSPQDVRRLLLELAKEVGNTVPVMSLATRLKLSRQTVRRYLDILEGIFVIFSVPAYYTDTDAELTKSRKYYFWDTGVKNALQREWTVSWTRSDIDELWENWMMAEILKQSRTFRRHEDLFFWQSRNGSKVDLIIRLGGKLHSFDFSLDGSKRPSQAFERVYGVQPTVLTPENFMSFVW